MILPSLLSLQSVLFPSDFRTKTLYESVHLLYAMRAIPPAHPVLLDLIVIKMWLEVQTMQLLNLQLSQVSCCLLPPGTFILLVIISSNTLHLHSSLNAGNQISRQYKTTRKIVVLYIFTYGPCMGVCTCAMYFKHLQFCVHLKCHN